MSASPARMAALEAVSRVRQREAYAHETMSAVLRDRALSPRDAAFATRLAYGTISCRGTLDEALSGYVDSRHQLQAEVSDALALSAYELLFMSTPARAAVSEGVELVRAVQPKASRLANAVLRRLAEKADDFPWGDPDKDTSALARLYGHPLWLAERFVAELGRSAAQSVMAANNEPAPMYLAHLPHVGAFETAMDALSSCGADPVECELSGCIEARVPAAAIACPALSSKAVVVADAAAQFAAMAVGPRAGWTVVDVGAGKGTKSLLMSGLARLDGGVASIIAVDNHAFKLEVLERSAEQLGAGEIETLVADAADTAGALANYAGSVDAVLVDAPCTGLGTLRRHPDRRWKARPDEIDALAELGRSLLDACAPLVRAGGLMVYSTCTITRRENEDVISGFLTSEGGRKFSIDPLSDEVPPSWRGFLSEGGWFRSLPTIGGPDGHFVARLRRND